VKNKKEERNNQSKIQGKCWLCWAA